MGIIPDKYSFAKLTTDRLAEMIRDATPVVVIVPVGSIEPHGPHLPLETDILISRATAVRAAEVLAEKNIIPLIAPDVSYGVTECAAAFKGAVSVSAKALSEYLRSLIKGFLANDVAHVCLVNNHLEPAHDRAVRAATKGIPEGRASVASPLTKRWARTLSEEFKSGACHAGEYETSIVMAADPTLVDKETIKGLDDVPVSLSEKLTAGVTDFVDMGLTRAYSGAPAKATEAHGHEQIDRLAAMVATEILDAVSTNS